MEHIINFFKYLWERIFCIILLVLFIGIITYLFFSNSIIQNPETVESQQILFCGISLENIATWFTSIALICTALWSMYQFVKSRTSKQQEKASEIASKFANNLIEKLGLISKTLLSNSEIAKIVKTIDNSTVPLSQFTIYEIKEIFNDEHIFKKVDNILKSDEIQKTYTDFLKDKYSEQEKQKFSEKFPVLVESTLNELEAICINISSQAAGSQFIYDSLHQYFLSTVKILSITISSNNSNNVDKYYTNIIQVYNMWTKQKNLDIKKLNKTNSKINKMHKKVDKEVKKLLSKKSKTV